MWVLTTQPSFEMETRAMFGRLMAIDVKHDDLLASGRSRRSLRSVEKSFSDFDDPSSQPGNSPSESMLRRDLQLKLYRKAADGSNSLNQINLMDEPMLSDLSFESTHTGH